jgi:hypothetical protein
VYDVSNFLDEHPGGKKILQRVLGQDASKQFWKYHNEKVMAKWGTPLKIGSIGSADIPPKTAAKPPVPYSPPRPKPQSTPQTPSPSPSPSPSTDNKSAPEIFGEVLPPTILVHQLTRSSSRSQNQHGTQASLPRTTTHLTTVFEISCAITWTKILSLTSLSGKKRSNNPRNCSNKSQIRGSSLQPCSHFLPRSTCRV